MKNGSILLLKMVILIIGIPVLIFCMWLPMFVAQDVVKHPETADLVYTFLILAYIAAIPFFTALYQSFKLLSYIEKNNAFSEGSMKALLRIKYCAISMGVLIVIGLISLCVLSAGTGEDITGFFTLAFIFTFTAMVVAMFANVLQRLLKAIIHMKLENDLIV